MFIFINVTTSTEIAVITPEEVRQHVDRFWKAFASKQNLEEYYSYDARVFGSMATRVEFGRLAAIRRGREYFNPQTRVDIRITSPIDVLERGNTAIACYSYEFRASKANVGLEKAGEEHIRNGRVTHVFAKDEEGRLSIIHEHCSQADTWTTGEAFQVKLSS